MSADTGIEWTDATWNPVRGCTKISPGCKHCYAETFAERWRGVKGHAYEQGFDLRLVPEALDLPLHWKKPRQIFVNSMSDLFHEDVPDKYIGSVFGRMRLAHWHVFQVLTKRAQRMQEWVSREMPEPLPNVWLGVSVEDQQRADERIPHLLLTPAAVRFLSCEPLLGPVDLRQALLGDVSWNSFGDEIRRSAVGWVIVGGESGSAARPMRLEWARSIVEQCRAANVPAFLKQLGANVESNGISPAGGWWPQGTRMHDMRGHWRVLLKNKKGNDPSEWPADLRVREFPR